MANHSKVSTSKTALQTVPAVNVMRQRMVEVFIDIEKGAEALTKDLFVLFELALDDESLDFPSSFRRFVRQTFHQVLLKSASSPTKVTLFSEMFEGFTVMVFKKTPLPPSQERRRPSTVSAEPAELEDAVPESAEQEAAALVSQQYFERTQHKVLFLETSDAVLLFFPVRDIRQNLLQIISLDENQETSAGI